MSDADAWREQRVQERFNLKAADREADRRIRELESAGRPPVALRDGKWLNAYVPQPVAWAVPGIIPEGVALLAGPPKVGKSWLLLSTALAISSGSAILGALNGQPPRPVLYLALEDSDRRMKDRCAQLGYSQVPGLFEYATEAHPESALQAMWDWLAAKEGQRPVLFVDTLGKIMPPARKGETIYDRDYRIGGYMKAIAASRPGSSVVINHHTRKQGAEDFIDRVSGTDGITGAPDTILVLTRKRGETTASLHVTGRDVDEETYQLTSFPYWELDGGSLHDAAMAARDVADRENLGDRSQVILGMLAEHDEITPAEVAEKLAVPRDAASTYLGRLAANGRVRRQSRGVYVSAVPNTPNTPNTEQCSCQGSVVSTVGCVRCVGSKEQNQHSQHGIRKNPEDMDLTAMAGYADFSRGLGSR